MKDLVKQGQITSYAISPFEVNSALSANIIAFESYKINLMGSRLFDLDFESDAGLDGALNALNQISADIGLSKGLQALKVDYSNRDLEMNRLLLGAQAIEQAISFAKKNSHALKEKSDKSGKGVDLAVRIERIQCCLEKMNTFMTHSEIFLSESIKHVAETKVSIALTQEKLKKMKEDWLYDLN